MTAATAYPLAWPLGWARSTVRRPAAFKDGKSASRPTYGNYQPAIPVSIAVARERLQRELDHLAAINVILSTNVELRLDGHPRSARAEPTDTGAALYFNYGGRDTVLACDKWDRVADNIVAIAKHIEALRGQERWGVGTMAQAFAGYQALPSVPGWHETLEVAPTACRADIDAAYRRKARSAHPDTGGSRHSWDRLQAAYEQAKGSVG